MDKTVIKPKKRIFLSFDHNDAEHVHEFMSIKDLFENFHYHNHKLDRRVLAGNVYYVCKIIREEYIRPAGIVVVLIGNNTAQSSWVNWEIAEGKNQGKPIMGIRLKNLWGPVPEGIPPITVGDWRPEKFVEWIDQIHG